jgi:hypothetical protein
LNQTLPCYKQPSKQYSTLTYKNHGTPDGYSKSTTQQKKGRIITRRFYKEQEQEEEEIYKEEQERETIAPFLKQLLGRLHLPFSGQHPVCLQFQ